MKTTAALLVLLVPGCFWVTTKHEGKEIKKDVKTLETKVQTQEDALGTKVKELETVLEKATKLLARNSADLGADVNTLQLESAKLLGLVNEATELANEVKVTVDNQRKLQSERIDRLEKRLAELEETVNKIPKKSAATLWAEGKAAYDAGNHGQAQTAFKTLVIKFPTDGLADDAQYYRGESHYRAKQYRQALGELQKVFEKYPTSTWAPKALYRAGEAALQLKWCTDARAYFGLLRQKYPKDKLSSKAKSKDREIKRNATNKRKCQS